jgi:uncharacterized membrane protein
MVTGARSVHGIDVARVEAAIEAAERRTSSELRVAISRFYFWGDVRHAAETAFQHLRMDRTRRRNAVLIFVAPRLRRFALVGDVGLDAHLTPAFWTFVASQLQIAFAAGDLTGGIERAVATIADLLAAHFPPETPNKNELPNQVAL